MRDASSRRAPQAVKARPKTAPATVDLSRDDDSELGESPLLGELNARKVLHLQRLVGNQRVAELLVARSVAAPPKPKSKDPVAELRPLELEPVETQAPPSPALPTKQLAPPTPASGKSPSKDLTKGVDGAGKPGGAESGASAEAVKAPTAGGAGGGGGGQLDGPPPIGETVAEIPEPSPPDAGALGKVGQAAKGAAPETGQPGAAPTATQATGFEQDAQGVASATSGGKSGGLLDTIVEAGLHLLQSITSGVAGTATSTASGVGGKANETSDKVTGDAGKEGQAAVGDAQQAGATAATEASGHVGQAHQAAHAAVGAAAGQAQQTPSKVSGQLQGLVKAVLAGAPALETLISPFKSAFSGIFDNLPGKLKGILAMAQGAVDGVLNTAIRSITAASQRIGAAITRAGEAVEGALAWVAEQTAALRQSANARLASLPSLARNALQSLVDRLLGAVQRAAAALAERAKRVIDAAVATAKSWLQTLTTCVTGIIDRVRKGVDLVFAGLRKAIDAAVARLNAIKAWLIRQAMAFLSRAIRAAVEPLYRRAYKELMDLIGPEVEAAIARARLMFPNGVPAPQQVVAAASQAAAKAGPSILDQIKQGLLNPEGDHFGIGFTAGGSESLGAGFSVAGGGTLDVVMDYRRNDIGFFVSPQFGGQLTLGAEVAGTGDVAGVGSWGTVASFGKKEDDVLAAYGGWFTNVNYGAQAGLAAEVGVAVSTGGAFYRGGSVDLIGTPLISYTPLGADTKTTPGDEHPGAPIPGTPAKTANLDLGEVHFGRQQSNAAAQPGGSAAIDSAARIVLDMPTKQPGASVLGVSVVGEASRVWLHPKPGKSRDEENADLGAARAQSVKGGLDGRLGGKPPVSAHSAGDHRAKSEGKPDTDASPTDQRAVMFADVNVPGKPDTVGPSSKDPDKQEKQKHDVKASLPNPFTTEKAAFGWDTTVGIQGQVGAGGQLAGYAGAGVSYSFPIGKTHLSAKTMESIRINFAVMKILMDLISISPLGLLRDIVALARVKVATDAEADIAKGVTQHVVKLPPGVPTA